jgi:hypothetical protein
MNTNLVNIIKRIIAEQGEGILGEPARLKGYVADYAAAESKAERLAFGRCIEHGAYNELKNTPDRQAAKAALARRVNASEGIDLALCNGVLDALEAALYGIDEPAVPPRTQTAAKAAGAVVIPAQIPQAAPIMSVKKTRKIRNILIAAGVLVISVFLIIIALQPPRPNPVELDEDDHIILYQRKNNDKFIKWNFALTLQHVQATQNFITMNYPGFDFEELGYVTDDYRNKLFVRDFNDNPQAMYIYLEGIEKMAGKSQVYAQLFLLELDGGNEEFLLGYYFSKDQEFSDRSGIEYHNSPLGWTYPGDGKLNTIRLYKYLYSDTNEPYWEIKWDNGISSQERFVLLKIFLDSLRYKKVFKELGVDFFKYVYTGIEQNQRIEDIVDWWGL